MKYISYIWKTQFKTERKPYLYLGGQKTWNKINKYKNTQVTDRKMTSSSDHTDC